MQKQDAPSVLILASASPYRRELLSRLGLPFDIAAPQVDETPLPDEPAAKTSLRLAIAKATRLAGRFPGALLIGSDQVALLDGQQLGKPGDHARATAQLRAMRGRIVEFHTAVALYNAASDAVQTHVDLTRVMMRDYSDTEIETYLLRERPYDCAGSAKIEALGITMVAAVESRDPTAIIGLPLIALCAMLRSEGVALP
ncbi:Maf family nucleotide pyrophosphatase [Chitiniphilus purpureus]|uniref:7-methyl-GTP pyrophosphatase n=1 Tax=Chitiniphilus purpureus TaxID=2981137 RepID=A0ABY6DL17_9NEIS|nr:Maf family nucleotide pyrophosphatase [Chitiniphilus sp. CD1]UXY14928.1 Maf family nucleotide pyrophosphatase [Chitiniphilus sp. CD1]